MKYGLIVYLETDNIGDDILSYAAMRFLPRIDYIIDRENLDIFVPEKKEYVKAIMNGWYLYHKSHWPPSPYIYPLITGIHLTDNYLMGIKDEYLDGMGKDFLAKYQPIGCRDAFTLKKMQDRGIESFFSGCLTLTLDKFQGATKHGKYVLVDVPNEVQHIVLKKVAKEEVEICTHKIDERDRGKDWAERVDTVERMLKKYQGAKLVITTRLHCALPCLALGTPVVLIVDENDDSKARLESYEKYLFHCTTKEFIDGSFKWQSFSENLNNHIELRNAIKKMCIQFIESEAANQKEENLPDIKQFKGFWSDKATWQRRLHSADLVCCSKKTYNELQEANQWMKNQLVSKDRRIEELEKYIEELSEGKNWLEKQGFNQQERIKELEDWIHKLEEGKKWLEDHAAEQEKYIQFLKSSETKMPSDVHDESIQ